MISPLYRNPCNSVLKKGKKGVDAKDGAKVDNDSSAVDDTVGDESSDTMGDAEREMTPEEKHLWYQFLKPQGIKAKRQQIIKTYIVDIIL